MSLVMLGSGGHAKSCEDVVNSFKDYSISLGGRIEIGYRIEGLLLAGGYQRLHREHFAHRDRLDPYDRFAGDLLMDFLRIESGSLPQPEAVFLPCQSPVQEKRKEQDRCEDYRYVVEQKHVIMPSRILLGNCDSTGNGMKTSRHPAIAFFP